jgi:ATP-binding cassette subfamily F protein 3
VFAVKVCGDVLHVSGVARRLTQTHGSYSTWSKRRGEMQKAAKKRKELRQEEIDKLKEYAGHGFKYGGSSSQINMMQMKAKQARKLEEEAKAEEFEVAALQEDMELPLGLKAGGEVRGFCIQLLRVSFNYPGSETLFKEADFSVDSESRIILLVRIDVFC